MVVTPAKARPQPYSRRVFIPSLRASCPITEAGARWYQGFAADAGSPLTVLHWLEGLRAQHAENPAMVPGVFLAWEMMVGESNTRWSDYNGPPGAT